MKRELKEETSGAAPSGGGGGESHEKRVERWFYVAGKVSKAF